MNSENDNPFLISDNLKDDIDESAIKQRYETMLSFNGLIEQYIEGRRYSDEILDAAEELGLGADRYLEFVNQGVTALYECQGKYYKDQNGIIVPA